jgi:hypothetical protein
VTYLELSAAKEEIGMGKKEIASAKPLIVDPEFQALMPSLTSQEGDLLAAALKKDGCRDAVVVWSKTGAVLDGHNRLKLCQALKIPYRTHYLDLPDRKACLAWIAQNQLGRRNLTTWQRCKLVEYLRPEIAALCKQNQKMAGKPVHRRLRTDDLLGEKAGVSGRTIQWAKRLLEHAPDEIIKALDDGTICIDRAYFEVMGKQSYYAKMMDENKRLRKALERPDRRAEAGPPDSPGIASLAPPPPPIIGQGGGSLLEPSGALFYQGPLFLIAPGPVIIIFVLENRGAVPAKGPRPLLLAARGEICGRLYFPTIFRT